MGCYRSNASMPAINLTPMTEIKRPQTCLRDVFELRASELAMKTVDSKASSEHFQRFGHLETCLDRLYGSSNIGECLQQMSELLNAEFAAAGDWDEVSGEIRSRGQHTISKDSITATLMTLGVISPPSLSTGHRELKKMGYHYGTILDEMLVNGPSSARAKIAQPEMGSLVATLGVRTIVVIPVKDSSENSTLNGVVVFWLSTHLNDLIHSPNCEILRHNLSAIYEYCGANMQ